MKGTLVNAAAVLVGSGAGCLLRQGLPQRWRDTVMAGLGLAVGVIGLQMALKGADPLLVIISLVLGAISGEALDLDGRLKRAGDRLTARVGEQFGDVGKGFVTASLVYCVGAMAVVGAIQEGLSGDAGTLYAKAMLDGVSAVVFAAGMGIGVAFSAVSLLLYQGSITLLAGAASSVINEAMLTAVTATGGVLIIGISLLVLEVKTIRVANLLPAIVIAALLAKVWP